MSDDLKTKLAHTWRRDGDIRLANPAIERASTVLIQRAEDLYDWDAEVYGRFGLGTQRALSEALKDLYGAKWCGLTGSGLSACAFAIQAFAKSGGHILITDSAYGPTRNYALEELTRQNVAVEFFDPRIGGEIANLIRDETTLIFCESPGSLTLEVQDLPAISKAAHARGAPVAVDDTWSAGMLCNVFDLGCDIAVQAATKYPAGHSDVLLGAILTRDEKLGLRIGDTLCHYGIMADPDSCYLTLRGLRTLPLRLKAQEEAGLKIANWLREHPKVTEMIHPALASHPDHAIWKRDFDGACGLFAFNIGADEIQAMRFLNALRLFGLGFSWGGFESLAVHCNPQLRRAAKAWDREGTLIRLSIGLEAPEDLIADLDQALRAIA